MLAALMSHPVVFVITTWTILMHETLSYTGSPGRSATGCSHSRTLGVIFLLWTTQHN